MRARHLVADGPLIPLLCLLHLLLRIFGSRRKKVLLTLEEEINKANGGGIPFHFTRNNLLYASRIIIYMVMVIISHKL
jgi:hypothetical protein